ncbi:hypothetical protein [Pelagicoccus sp. SDUM812002]|uniref:hypothetical protein n=1 Tax=Pelagicoccus sp. SDUM812002 TaxID=3041266 RepID=UPI00280DAF5D|nr:hypothetical protein [Pelagicoccus sp. SDUM812002]MDQ8186992.1 hypothetical protein [Pelagicoccus sp. SDUM812002]
MQIHRLFRYPLLGLLLSILGPVLFAVSEREVVEGAINAVDHYLQAGADNNAQRGAGLLESYDDNARRAAYDTQRLYRREQNLLSQYLSISNSLYGYEIRKGLLGTSVELEGGIETLSGVRGEFKARVIFKNKRWRIADLEID